ncbi:MAG: hypothetical protein OXH68_15295 [Gammaproteobacteria bacterium]|nr:hypothetical protein [Gammaproteobacteria bacterium]
MASLKEQKAILRRKLQKALVGYRRTYQRQQAKVNALENRESAIIAERNAYLRKAAEPPAQQQALWREKAEALEPQLNEVREQLAREKERLEGPKAKLDATEAALAKLGVK